MYLYLFIKFVFIMNRYLNNKDLIGTIPLELGKLSNLKKL